MNLVIDAGNTLTKSALFSGNEIASFSSFEGISAESIKRTLELHPSVKNIILSSVVDHDKEISNFLNGKYHFIELSHDTSLPLENLYESPQTLGKDRLAAAVGANFIYRGQDVLAIDAGTCIKYDYVNANNQYMGGAISPGIEMRFKALNQFTDKLPLVQYKYFDQLIGRNTEGSILSGVMNGITEEVKGVIARYEQQYPDIKVVFTGGYLKFFEKSFNIGGKGKSNIFADPFLVLKGLNHILNFNERK